MARRGTKPGGAACALLFFGGSLVFLGSDLATFASALAMLGCIAAAWLLALRVGQRLLARWHGVEQPGRRKGA